MNGIIRQLPIVKAPREIQAFRFDVNRKQNEFHDTVMKSVARQPGYEYRRFFYGGAIRGGKTFVCLYILDRLARLYPGSRWHVIRSDFPELESTSIPSMEKLIGKSGGGITWKRKQSNYHVLYDNGSRIFFMSEKLKDDPNLDWMLGLETNGFLLEQMEGLSERCLTRANERAGSWYLIDGTPIPLIMGTFNPSPTWVKGKIYDRWLDFSLPENDIFIEATPKDNMLVTEDQWRIWNNLDPLSYAQMIEAQWQFDTAGNLFAYAFDERRTVVDVLTEEGRLKMAPDKRLPIKVYFDFNVDPITALICQHHGIECGKIIQEYRLRNSDIFELCERILTDWAGYFLIASGDASGANRSALTRGNRTYIQTIQKEMKLGPRQMAFTRSNPVIKSTRVVMNSVFKKHPAFWISNACNYLLNDLRTAIVDENGELVKKTTGANKLKFHLFDNSRYFIWNDFRKFVNM